MVKAAKEQARWWETCNYRSAVVNMLVAMIAVGFGYWASYNTYLMSLDFDNIAKTLQTRFTTNATLACTEASLQHPAEDTVEWWLNSTRENDDSLNLLFYGEAMLGKSCTVRKILDKLSEDKARFFYHMYNRGFDAFVEDLCYPAIIGPDKQKAVYIALAKYAEYMKVHFIDRFNALIVVDFVNYNDTAALEILSKTVRDLNYPIRFVFIASEARAPAIFQRRVDKVRLTEGGDELARNYLREIVGIKDKKQRDSIVQFTGSIFKYLAVVKKVWSRTSGDIEATKQAVHKNIRSEIGFLLDPELYPEVVEICKQLVTKNGILQIKEVTAIVRQNYTEPPKGDTKLSRVQVFEKNLFLVDEELGVVRFQNRAIANFVSSLLEINEAIF